MEMDISVKRLNFGDEGMVNICTVVRLETVGEVSSLFDLKVKSMTAVKAKWPLDTKMISRVERYLALCA